MKPENDVSERLKEFEKALDKYLHLLHGGRVDRKKAIDIERIELTLLDLFKEEGVCNINTNLNNNIIYLFENKHILNKIINIIEKLEENEREKTSIDLKRGLNEFLTGNIETRDAMVAAIVVQSLARCIAEQKLEENIEERLSPICPICGAESRTMVVRDRGYSMICSFCGYEWRIARERPRCPWCGNDNPISIGVFTNKQRRIGLMICQECGSTWRAILDRRINAPNILLPLISLGAEAFRVFVSSDMVSTQRIED